MKQQPNSKMLDFLAFTEGMQNMAPPVDPTKLLMQQMQGDQVLQAAQEQTKANALPQMMMQFAGQPDMLKQAYPWFPTAGDGMPGSEDLIKALQGGPQVKERKPVLDDQGQAAEALVDENGNIIGFAQPGTDQMMEDFLPSGESIGGFPAWKYKAGDWWKNLFSFNKPQFQ